MYARRRRLFRVMFGRRNSRLRAPFTNTQQTPLWARPPRVAATREWQSPFPHSYTIHFTHAFAGFTCGQQAPKCVCTLYKLYIKHKDYGCSKILVERAKNPRYGQQGGQAKRRRQRGSCLTELMYYMLTRCHISSTSRWRGAWSPSPESNGATNVMEWGIFAS